MSIVAKPGRYKAPNGETVLAMRWDGTPECEHAMWLWTNGACTWRQKRQAFGFQKGIVILNCGVGDWIVLDSLGIRIENAGLFGAGYTELPYEEPQPHVIKPDT